MHTSIRIATLQTRPCSNFFWAVMSQGKLALPIYIDLLKDSPNGVLLDEGIPPEAPDDRLQALRRRHDAIIWHNSSQDAGCETLIVCGWVEGPKRCGV